MIVVCLEMVMHQAKGICFELDQGLVEPDLDICQLTL